MSTMQKECQHADLEVRLINNILIDDMILCIKLWLATMTVHQSGVVAGHNDTCCCSQNCSARNLATAWGTLTCTQARAVSVNRRHCLQKEGCICLSSNWQVPNTPLHLWFQIRGSAVTPLVALMEDCDITKCNGMSSICTWQMVSTTKLSFPPPHNYGQSGALERHQL